MIQEILVVTKSSVPTSVRPYKRPPVHVTESEMSHFLAWRDLQSVLNLILDCHVMVMQLTSVRKGFR